MFAGLPLRPLTPSLSLSGPPRVSERVAHRQSARLGRTVKLPCPVEGDPPPLIMWTKDGRNIHSGWSRFRVLQHGLRVKEVETEDAGTYVCKATNGFGSVNVNYTLIVIGRKQLSLTRARKRCFCLLLKWPHNSLKLNDIDIYVFIFGVSALTHSSR